MILEYRNVKEGDIFLDFHSCGRGQVSIIPTKITKVTPDRFEYENKLLRVSGEYYFIAMDQTAGIVIKADLVDKCLCGDSQFENLLRGLRGK